MTSNSLHGHFAGQIVLVAEDDALIGMWLAELLTDVGCAVLGPVDSAAAALALLARHRPAAAFLDHVLADGTGESVAVALGVMGAPYAFLTGDPAKFSESSVPVLEKPFETAAVYRVLAQLLP